MRFRKSPVGNLFRVSKCSAVVFFCWFRKGRRFFLLSRFAGRERLVVQFAGQFWRTRRTSPVKQTERVDGRSGRVATRSNSAAMTRSPPTCPPSLVLKSNASAFFAMDRKRISFDLVDATRRFLVRALSLSARADKNDDAHNATQTKISGDSSDDSPSLHRGKVGEEGPGTVGGCSQRRRSLCGNPGFRRSRWFGPG